LASLPTSANFTPGLVRACRRRSRLGQWFANLSRRKRCQPYDEFTRQGLLTNASVQRPEKDLVDPPHYRVLNRIPTLVGLLLTLPAEAAPAPPSRCRRRSRKRRFLLAVDPYAPCIPRLHFQITDNLPQGGITVALCVIPAWSPGYYQILSHYEVWI